MVSIPLVLGREELFPLSFAQERLWVINHLEPGLATYNVPLAIRITGPLNYGALSAAVTAIVMRHKVLRTRIVTPENWDSGFQIIDPPNQIDVVPEDLGIAGKEEIEREIEYRLSVEVDRPFNIEKERLMRVLLLRSCDTDHVLIMTFHEIVCDGWSLSIITNELSNYYSAFSKNRSPILEKLPIQYVDFAIWQKTVWWESVAAKTQVVYWLKHLADAPGGVDLPTDKPRPSRKTFRGASRVTVLEDSISVRLTKLIQQEAVTPFMAVVAALATMLSRYSCQDDIVIGILVSNRTAAHTEQLVGLFVNILPLRVDLSGSPSFRDILRRVRDVALDAYSNQELPFEKIVQALTPTRTAGRNPVTQVMVNSVDLDLHAHLPDSWSLMEIDQHDSKFDLTVYFEAERNSFKFNFQYSTDLFKETTIDRLVDAFTILLSSIVENPDCPVSSLPIVTEAERKARTEQRDGVRPHNAFVRFVRDDIEGSLSARFEAQVTRSPGALAISDAEMAWSYEALDLRANGIASSVQSRLGAGPGYVALLYQQSAAMVAAMLGVLKAGKTYVPLDPLHPVERLRFIMRDTGAGMILSEARCLELAAACTTGATPLVNGSAVELATKYPSMARGPDTRAYVLYTSGTMGRPKGVVQSDRNVMHFIAAYTNALHIHAGDRLSLFASYGFDASVMDIYGALLNGASLHVCDVRRVGFDDLREWLTERHITVWHSTPTFFRIAVSCFSDRAPSSVRLLVLGGEEAVPEDLALLRKYFAPDCLLVNGFGPTESTVTLQYFASAQSEVCGGRLPIGYPVEATQVILLDESGRPTDLAGEIAIRSPHVALGYLNRPALTAERFMPSPLGNGERLYRTGDLARWRRDGGLEYLGRIDQQVKIRGLRVDLGEVEAVLRLCPGVQQAVVVSREDSGHTRLVAYVVSTNDVSLDIEILRERLRAWLPEYMLPRAYVKLQVLPLTPNGKVDRAALPVPKEQPNVSAYEAPSTSVEQAVATIWAEVLQLERVGRADNFFGLGGDSLSATRVIVRVRKMVGVNLALRAIFEAPTLRGLCHRIEITRKAEVQPRQ